MLVGALLDLGASLVGLREDLSRLGVAGFEVDSEKKWRGGLAGTHFVVRIDPAWAKQASAAQSLAGAGPGTYLLCRVIR